MIDDSQGNLSGFYTEPTIPVAGLRVSLEITCRQDEEGFASALEALHTSSSSRPASAQHALLHPLLLLLPSKAHRPARHID